MNELSARQANKHGGTAAFRLITVLHHENQQRAQRIITAIMGSKRTSGVTVVQYKSKPNSKECTPTSSKERIEEVCARENESKFRQTENIELMRPPYTTLLCYIGDT